MDIEAQIKKVKLEDGDVLVITCPDHLRVEIAAVIRDKAVGLLERLGVDAQVMILDGGMQAALLKTSQLPKHEE